MYAHIYICLISFFQVYKGFLKPHKDSKESEGIRVAVKIIHPHVEKIVRVDMDILRFFARQVNKIPQVEFLALPETVEVFAKV